jgi:short-subunit dehydrogenase
LKDLKGRTVLLTGATGGVGRCLVECLANEQVHLLLVGREADALERLAASVRQRGLLATAVQGDLSTRETVEDLAARAQSVAGEIDVLVSNAGTATVLPFHRMDLGDLHREIYVNMMAPLVLARSLLPGMVRRGRGHIACVTSLTGEVPIPFFATYSAAKAGLTSFARSLRMEYWKSGVSASAILPGVIWGGGMITDFSAKSGFVMPRRTGGCTPQWVAKAVIKAIKKDVPEIVVNMPPVRPGLALMRLFPRLGEWFLVALGAREPGAAAAKMNIEAGGQYTGVTVAPEDIAPQTPAEVEQTLHQTTTTR